MSIFNDVMQSHDQAQQAIEARRAEEAAKKAAEIEVFVSKVELGFSAVVIPLFEEFVRDAAAYGFAAKLDEYTRKPDAHYVSLRIIPIKGSSFSTNASVDSVFAIKAVVATQKVHYLSYFDQRPGVHNGVTNAEYGWQSLNRDQLERVLKDFLSRSVKSRS
ncbi:hypothetical protein [Pseudomonas sp. URMO17WK12:I11]|uniref:hypothetical protein n=1 Tax=Pseudomonas sp. URMO17WK12:I11 TaxID=1283291 RepID=UPI00071FC4A9|nr:hypothetical protein [Pseudomonas sp. URMO17WK12:I11]CRL47736.1 hypothetical protein PSHI_07760 [Pseudomonas sp. URMO17WK12:I11]